MQITGPLVDGEERWIDVTIFHKPCDTACVDKQLDWYRKYRYIDLEAYSRGLALPANIDRTPAMVKAVAKSTGSTHLWSGAANA